MALSGETMPIPDWLSLGLLFFYPSGLLVVPSKYISRSDPFWPPHQGAFRIMVNCLVQDAWPESRLMPSLWPPFEGSRTQIEAAPISLTFLTRSDVSWYIWVDRPWISAEPDELEGSALAFGRQRWGPSRSSLITFGRDREARRSRDIAIEANSYK